VSTIYELGAMIGALCGGYFIKYGMWNCLMTCNLIAMAGYLFMVVEYLWAVYVGRALVSLAIGGFCVFVPKFVNEITPIEFNGPIGGFAQFSITLGIFLPSIGGLTPLPSSINNDYLDAFIRLIWGFPIIFLLM